MTYNLQSTRGSVRIGNWQEELVLEGNTGVRFAPNPKERANGLLTKSRVIDHSDFVPVNKFQSTAQSTLCNPFQHKDYVGPGGTGPRRKFMESSMRNQVEKDFKDEIDSELNDKMKPQYITLNAEKFSREGFKESVVFNDPSVRVDTNSANYTTEPAITYYSHALSNNKDLNFPMSYVNSVARPFNKSLAFSADIHNASMRRSESHERPGAYPKVAEFQILSEMRDRIVANTYSKSETAFSIAAFVSMVWNMEEGDGLIHIDSFATAMERIFLFPLTSAEIDALHVMLDMKNDGCMHIREFIALVRGPFSFHRIELVQLAFAQCDTQQTGQVADEQLLAAFVGNQAELDEITSALNGVRSFSGSRDRPPNGLGLGGTVEISDFLEHYWNVSALVTNDSEFEEKIRQEFNL